MPASGGPTKLSATSRLPCSRSISVSAVVHQLAAFWIEYVERLDTPPAPRDLDDIERHVDKAIALSHGTVAHYLETKGRVLAMRGEFETARSAVAQAIEIEPRGSRDYLRRLTQHQTTRVRHSAQPVSASGTTCSRVVMLIAASALPG